MRKTLLITLDFFPKKGGVARYYKAVADNMPNNKIIVYTTLRVDGKEDNLDYNIIRQPIIKESWFFLKWLPSVIGVFKAVKRKKIELILIGEVLPLGYIAYLIKKIFKVPFILFFHGTDVLRSQSSFHKRYLTKLLIKKAERIVCNSRYTQLLLEKAGNISEKSYILYPSLDIERLSKLKLEPEKIISKLYLKNKKILLSVSRLVERKGIDRIIKSLPEILKINKDVIYLVVGDGKELESLQKLSQSEGISDKVVFLSGVPDDELFNLYSAADIFILSPRKIEGFDIEGFGIAYLEAGFFKKPVITSVSGGESEAVIDGVTGMIVGQNDIRCLADAVKLLLLDKVLRKKLGENSYQRVVSYFNQKQLINDFIINIIK